MIYIIGLGIEGKSSLSQKALKLIENAGILIGGKRHLAAFPEFKGKKVSIGSDLNKIAAVLSTNYKLRTPNSAVILATGDPNFFGIADFIIRKFGKKDVEIIPNVSAMQEAFARIKESWNDARFISVHGRNTVRSSEFGVRSKNLVADIVDEIVCYEKVGIFTDPENTPAKIAKAMIERGVNNYHAYVCEDLGTEKERIFQGTLTETAKKSFSPLNVMLLVRQGQGSRGKGHGYELANHQSPITTHRIFGIPDNQFSHSKGMITKEEIRVISLSKLNLKSDSIVWDIGAGCGSVAIEAAFFAKEGKVFAVEKDKTQVKHIQRNKKEFDVRNLEIVNKNAPSGLKTLTQPDAVFIGGGGKDIHKILAECSKRVKKGGRVVINAVTLDTLTTAAQFFKKSKWSMETISVNVAKTKNVSDYHLFNAHNPVFIIVGERS